MKWTQEEVEQLRIQAIEAEENRINNLQLFLDELDLESDVNKTVALEIGTSIFFIENIIEKLKIKEKLSEHEVVWQSFWAGICAPTGRMDEEQVKKELYDYKLLIDEVPKVYDELAGLSKPHTSARLILDRVYDKMINKEMAFDDLTASAENGEVTLTVDYLKNYFDIKHQND